MRRFAFRLERVREYRKWQEKLAQQALADARRRLNNARERLADAEAQAEVHQRALESQIRSGTTAGQALVHQIWALRLRDEVADCEDEVRRREDQTSAQRRELTKASQDRKALELLRERRLSEYRLAEGKAEQAVLDEVAGRLNGRRPGDHGEGDGRR